MKASSSSVGGHVNVAPRNAGALNSGRFGGHEEPAGVLARVVVVVVALGGVK